MGRYCRIIIVLVVVIFCSGCFISTLGNRESTFTYDTIKKEAKFDGRKDEKLTCKFTDGEISEITFDRTGPEGILEKVLTFLCLMPKMEVQTD